MSAYEIIISIDRNVLQQLHKKKLARASIFRDIEIYDYYLDECQNYSKTQARENTAKNFGISKETVSRTLQRLQ